MAEPTSPQPALTVMPFGAGLLSRLPTTHHKQASAASRKVPPDKFMAQLKTWMRIRVFQSPDTHSVDPPSVYIRS